MIVSLVLLIWLLYWINPTRRGIGGRWIAQRGLTRPWLGHQAADIEKITGAVRGTVPESDYGSFRDVLREHLTKAGQSARRALHLGCGGGRRPRAPSSSATTAAPSVRLQSQTLGSRRFRWNASSRSSSDAGERFPGQSRFLIWDAGQVGSDRNLGVYANGFLPKLRSFLDRESGQAAGDPQFRALPARPAPPANSITARCSGITSSRAWRGKGSTPNGLTVQSFTRYVRNSGRALGPKPSASRANPELFG